MEEGVWNFNQSVGKRKALSEIAKTKLTKRPEHQKPVLLKEELLVFWPHSGLFLRDLGECSHPTCTSGVRARSFGDGARHDGGEDGVDILSLRLQRQRIHHLPGSVPTILCQRHPQRSPPFQELRNIILAVCQIVGPTGAPAITDRNIDEHTTYIFQVASLASLLHSRTRAILRPRISFSPCTSLVSFRNWT